MSALRGALIAVGAVTGVMLVLAGIVLGSLSNRLTATDVVPVALINRDEPVTTGEGDDEQTVAAGRLLAAEITRGSESVLSWTIIDGDTEDASLDRYAAVVTIPESFSATMSGLREGTPESASIILETRTPASPVAGRIATEITTASAEVFDDDFTSAYLANVFLSYDGISEAVGESADGATTLAGGAADLSDASTSLADAATQVATGAASVEDGSVSLAEGAGSAAQGAQGVAEGASSLASSLSAVEASALTTLVPATEGSAGASAGLASALATLAAACPPTAGATYCAQVAATAQASGDASRAAAGADAAAKGITEAVGAAAAGAGSLRDGAADSAAGAASVAAGASSLTSGASELASSTSSLAGGASEVEAGAVALTDGAVALADGLDELQAAVPTYGEDSAVELADAVTSPTTLLAVGDDPAGRNGFTALAIGAALWVASAALYQRRPAVPGWVLSSGGSSIRAVFLGLAPRAALMVTGALLLWLAFTITGSAGSQAEALLGIVVAGAIVVTATAQAIYLVFGRRAWLVMVALGIVQVVAASLYAPLSTAPGLLRSLSDALPLSVVMRLARDAVFALPHTASAAGATLAVWLVLALATSLLALRARTSRDPALLGAHTPGMPASARE